MARSGKEGGEDRRGGTTDNLILFCVPLHLCTYDALGFVALGMFSCKAIREKWREGKMGLMVGSLAKKTDYKTLIMQMKTD